MKNISKDGKVDWGDDCGMRDGSPSCIDRFGTWCWYLPGEMLSGRYVYRTAGGKTTVIKIPRQEGFLTRFRRLRPAEKP